MLRDFNRKEKLEGKLNIDNFMTPELTKPQYAQEQLADLTQTLEKEKVQLTPEVENYVREHVRALQDKLQVGQDVRESDLAFIEKVKIWVSMSKEWRDKYKSVDEMAKSDEFKEIRDANKRHISPKQWQDLLHVAEATGNKREWIDETFKFPSRGEIRVEGDLDLIGCASLTSLPDQLEVKGYLDLSGCTSLTHLPEGLVVNGELHLIDCTSLVSLPKRLTAGWNIRLDGCTSLVSLPEDLYAGWHLFLSKDVNDQVKKDAERLKAEGKIKGEIKYRNQ